MNPQTIASTQSTFASLTRRYPSQPVVLSADTVRELDQLLARMRHDVNGPLTAIQLAVGLAREAGVGTPGLVQVEHQTLRIQQILRTASDALEKIFAIEVDRRPAVIRLGVQSGPLEKMWCEVDLPDVRFLTAMTDGELRNLTIALRPVRIALLVALPLPVGFSVECIAWLRALHGQVTVIALVPDTDHAPAEALAPAALLTPPVNAEKLAASLTRLFGN
jgi:hypothetical protein